jgi:hypothetical protein
VTIPIKSLTFFLVLIMCFNHEVKAQSATTYSPGHLYQPQALHADLAFLKSVLEEAHPSLYRYTSKDTLDADFIIADKQLDHPLTDLAFWEIAERYVAAVRSGHTVIYPSADYVAWTNTHPPQRLPLAVYLMEGHLYTATVPEKSGGLFRGTEITAIDGRSVSAILSGLKPLLSPEGHSNQFVNFKLESNFAGLYGLVFGFKPQYDITYIDSTGTNQHASLKADQDYTGYSIDKSRELLEQERGELEKSVEVNYFPNVPGTVELKIKRLTYLNDYKRFDAAFFKRLHDEKIKNLIIDLRDNGGGYLDIGIDMMRYMVRNYVIPAHVVTAATDEYSFSKYIVKGSDTLKKNLLVKTGKHTYAALNDYQLYYISANHIFTGKVYLLINSGTFSAASAFAANLSSQRNVTILGQESGGGEAGNDGRGFSIVKMPNTGLLLRLPQFWMATTTHHKDTGRGVIPDITVILSVADRLNNNDAVLTETLNQITDKK